MTKRFHPGRASENGVSAAIFAEAGLVGPRFILEAQWGGFYRTYIGDEAATPEATVQLEIDRAAAAVQRAEAAGAPIYARALYQEAVGRLADARRDVGKKSERDEAAMWAIEAMHAARAAEATARWGGMIKQRGLMCLAVGGNIATGWSWFGTNMLGVGLHSYGFTDAAFVALTAFAISQVVFIGIANLPLGMWRSFKHRSNVPSAPEHREELAPAQ
jgi:hypothetical protein